MTRVTYFEGVFVKKFLENLDSIEKKFLMFYLIACNTNLINADWTVASELTSYISFASISYLCVLFLTSKFVYVQKPVTIQ